jgi:3-hydroxybutyryl-CoA dehydrogenase
MKLAVISDEPMKAEFLEKGIPGYANVCFVQAPQQIPADTYIVFDLLYDGTPERVSLLKQFLPRPVFINDVTGTLAAIEQPFIRINAWPGFLKRAIAEVAVLPQQEASIPDVFEKLGWKYRLVADLPGMVSARVTAMLINEAYFALQESISTKKEIDTAMMLGTHLPYGPFEWSERIGLKNIYALLSLLHEENHVYEMSALLRQEALQIYSPKIN